ncbi:MAG: very short patch repair endonuclease, partial [Actinobacteria bacterium]|nr:very short patch repair endonuclease [Actinomycetota bacterium]
MAQVDPPPVTVKQADLGVPAGQKATETASRTVSLGGGQVVPYPEPLDDVASKVGRANGRVDTKPEVLIRSAVHRRGLRYRKDLLVRVEGLRVRPDLVFTRQKVAVFIDGCFWHRCPEHGTDPKRNVQYWKPKLQANVERDQRVTDALSASGWTVVRVWEHEDVD